MPRQPNVSRIKEYDQLHHFCNSLMEYLKGKHKEFSSWKPFTDDWRGGSPFSEAFSGLKQAVGDFLEMTREIRPEEQKEIDAYLSARGLITLTEMRNRIWQVIPKILKRGKIRNTEEYYLLKERVIDLDNPDMDEEMRKYAEEILRDYEFKTNIKN